MERQRDEKLKLMGEMAANIAHDIRNPLGSIELFASLLERDLKKERIRAETDTLYHKGCSYHKFYYLEYIAFYQRDTDTEERTSCV